MAAEKKKTEGVRRYCPYCEDEIKESAPTPVCKACGVTVFYCPSCRKPVEREKKVCPHCGTDLRAASK